MAKPKAVEDQCCICLAPIGDRRQSCDAHPVMDGRCCWKCDNVIVTPVRIARGQDVDIVAAIEQGLAIQRTVASARKEMA
jgi:hypothetical protein